MLHIGADEPNARRRARQQKQQEEAPLAGTGELLMTDDMMGMDDVEPLVLMEDDQLMGLPFGGKEAEKSPWVGMHHIHACGGDWMETLNVVIRQSPADLV